MDRWDFEKKIVLKALKDPAFKEKLLSHPKKAIEECLKGDEKKTFLSFPHIKIKVMEEKKDEWIFAIPWLEEISEEGLKEKAAGEAAGYCNCYT